MNTSTASPSSSTPGPLAGIRVLDLTAVVLGPVATQTLADYGADVIKVESPEGDLMRANGVSRHKGMSSIFLNLNRNKRSVVIDLKAPKGRAALLRLAATCDVLVHNMRVKAIERLGLGYEAVKAVRPDIVYCVATGFGEAGVDAGKPAFDDVIQGACGLADLIGRESGKPEYPPTLLADKISGLATANAVLAALVHKARTGQGQHVEVPMFETMVAFTMAEHMGGKTFVPATASAGYARLVQGGRKPAPTRDGHVAMLPYTTEHWQRFFRHFDRPDLAAKYDIQDRHERNRRVGELYADLRALTAQHTTAELVDACRQLDIPITEIYAIDTLDQHPHAQSVGLFQAMDHPSEGPMVAIRPTALFAATPTCIRTPAPKLGQDTEAVLHEAGFEAAEVSALMQAGVVRGALPSEPVA
ncbi:CoA transferase [Comamonas serinivorans]|uniref:CoA transferase n=1 Tax=Comamonas serinivorans TaxID=1082851 RepID=A0A1Y0EJN4_9BURK|nr:CoA transferase [Comamonas serinivorans]ARU03492.1 CoA transferase [Comamonas serinivorans]